MHSENILLSHNKGHITDYNFLKEVDKHMYELFNDKVSSEDEDSEVDIIAVHIWEYLHKKDKTVRKNTVNSIKEIMSRRLN